MSLPPPLPSVDSDASRRGAVALAKRLQTNAELGLTGTESARRLQANGANLLRALPTVSAWRRLILQFQSPLVYLLLAAMVIAWTAWLLEGQASWPIDALVIAAVVTLNAGLGWAEQAKAQQAVAALARMTKATASVIRDGRVQRVSSADLVCGDLLVLTQGDAVGADAQLIACDALLLQEASLTGESVPTTKTTGEVPANAAVAERTNAVFMGTFVVQGAGRALITATGMQTQMGQVATLLDATPEAPTHLETQVVHMGRQLALAVIVIAAIVVATVLAMSQIQSAADVVAVLLLGVALAVAAIPEGLPAILSLALALGVRRMAAHNAVIKKLSSVETLGAATVICTDKTGTLTRSEMTIQQCITASGTTHITGVGYEPQGNAQHDGQPLAAGPLQDELYALLQFGSLAGNATLSQTDGGRWVIEGDPTDAAFVVAAKKLEQSPAGATVRWRRVAQNPFTSARKMMSTVQLDCHAHDASVNKLMLMIKGAPDVVLARCTRVKVGAQTVALDDAWRARILLEIDTLANAALRTLGVACRALPSTQTGNDGDASEQNLVFLGVAGMLDPPRKEAALAIAQAQRAGIRIVMITGDHPLTAARIGRDLGIAEQNSFTSATPITSATLATPIATLHSGPHNTLTGTQLDALRPDELRQKVRTIAVYARTSPAHKLRIVAALQANGEVVAMTGDGVNDAPALKAADIGVAMGITGSEVAKEAAKVILVDDNFATLVQAVREGRSILDNIRKFLRYLLSSNMGEVLTVFLGVIGGSLLGLSTPLAPVVVLPLLATQILWLNLITDSWPALAMGVDPATDDVMLRPPEHVNQRLIDTSMWLSIFEMGLLIAVLTLLTIDFYLPGGLIEGTGELTTARTAGFTTLVFAHLFQCFNARSDTRSAFTHLGNNRWLWAAVGTSLALQVAAVHLPILNLAFSTAPLSLAQWLVCLSMGSVVVVYSELRKLVRRWQLTAHLETHPADV